MSAILRVFLGWDSNEAVSYHVLAHSILRHASVPVSVTPLKLSQLPMTRERTPTQSTEFSFSRFLVPWLCGYEGQAIFMDCDMLCRDDIAGLHGESRKAVSVVKHDYQPRPEDKFLGQRQSIYAKKNWSSVMVFDNNLCRKLTPEYVNSATGLELHQFKWLPSDAWIGSLAPEWNCLISEENQCRVEEAKILHFSRGGPWFKKFSECDGSNEWFEEKSLMLHYNGVGEYSLKERQAA